MSFADVQELKSALAISLPIVKSSHRCEALGRGLGFRTYAALLADTREHETITTFVDGTAFKTYLADHCFDVEAAMFYQATGRVALRKVLSCDPKLTLAGIGIGHPQRNEDGTWETPTQSYERMMESRKEFLDDHGVRMFLLALALVSRIKSTKTVRRGTGSYRLKHIAENYNCSYPNGEKLGPCYVSNGALIAAAVYAGFQYKTSIDDWGYLNLNVIFNMSKAAIDELDCEIRPDGPTAQDRRWYSKNRAA